MEKRQATILIVDDEPKNVKLLEAYLKPEGYITQTATSGEAALAMVAHETPDLILLDIMMPGIDGLQVAGKLKADPATKVIPIIMVTALNDRDSKLAALNMGAEEFLNKPVDRAELWVRVRNLLRLKEYNDFLANYNRVLEQRVEERTVQLKESHLDTIFTMTRAAEYKDEDTGVHVQRVSYYSAALAENMGMDSEFSNTIFYASPMHDVGKIGIPDHILLKPGQLSAEEWGIMKSHCAFGAEILKSSKSPFVKMGGEIALAHHERWDGSGYPHGLKGEAIPLSGRIMSICDVYDALRSKRPYKPPYDHEKTMAIITEGDGRTRPEHFDPTVLAAFGSCSERFRGIFEELSK
jgi:putative two-component system response regulator